MKKTLSILSIAALLATATPSVIAAPHGGQGGGHGAGQGMERQMGGGPRMEHYGGHRLAPDYHRHHGGGIALGLGARRGYWGYPYCDYCGVGWYDGFYGPCYPHRRQYRPYWSGGIYIDF